MIPLFTRYPILAERCSYRPIGDWPTPVEELPELGKLLDVGRLFVKRDDISGRPYGGNKVRKLEFLLADAEKRHARAVLTFGRAGSNHALATAVYGRAAGLDTIALLLPQPNAGYVRRNLLWSLLARTELHQQSNVLLLGVAAVYHFLRHTLRDRRLPMIIAPGGSSPLGTVGYVNAALELEAQIAAGLLPEPDLIYVTAATMGTAAGLLLGLRLAGLQSRVIAVRVTEEAYASEKGLVRLAGRTNDYLRRLDKTISRLTFGRDDFDLCHDFYGGEYGRFTPECMSAVALMKEMCALRLEGTYTGKTFAALAADARQGALADKVVLFWHTANSREAPAELATADYKQLPRSFHRYFEQPLQELDHE
jgi:D-cysteine desulfhydrase